MVPSALNETVYPDDLILVYTRSKRCMLLVKSAPGDNNTNPSTSTIIVEPVDWHIPDKNGYWNMSGPDVYYVKECEEDEEGGRQEGHSHSPPETTLAEILESEEDQDISLIRNPHGRYVTLLLSHPKPLLGHFH